MRGYAPSLEAKGPTRTESPSDAAALIERAVVLREGERRGVAVSDAALERR